MKISAYLTSSNSAWWRGE